MSTPKRVPGACLECEGRIPAHYRADRRTCSDACRGRARRSRNPGRHLEERYGMTTDDREAMLAAQGGRCALCDHTEEARGKLHVDHDHATGAVRALLCTLCNTALGKFSDNPALLRAAADYIEAHR